RVAWRGKFFERKLRSLRFRMKQGIATIVVEVRKEFAAQGNRGRARVAWRGKFFERKLRSLRFLTKP
ncbi:MAG: hypothetical protein NC337_01215, partial [Roseburia sp.]|nr:hypothetical protein [Roseburia sp.]